MAKQMKYADGTFGMGTEWIHDFLFDRFRLLNANPLVTALFRDKAGSARNGVVLTAVDTNNKGDRVPTQQKWYLWNLTIIYQAAAIRTDAAFQTILDFLRNTNLTLRIENLDIMFQAPISAFQPELQIVGTAQATFNGYYPLRFAQGETKFTIPVVLEQNAVWHLDIEQTAASAAGLDNDFLLFNWDRELYRQGG